MIGPHQQGVVDTELFLGVKADPVALRLGNTPKIKIRVAVYCLT